VLSVTGLFIKPVQDAILGLFAKKTTAVMTNVPGPAVPLKFCGSTLRQNMFWVPASGDVGVGVSILSYGGGVQFGLITDPGCAPSRSRSSTASMPEFEKLLLLTMMLPWVRSRLPQKTWLRALSRMMPTLGLKPSLSSIIKPQFLDWFHYCTGVVRPANSR
jgi:hypothetical protein